MSKLELYRDNESGKGYLIEFDDGMDCFVSTVDDEVKEIALVKMIGGEEHGIAISEGQLCELYDYIVRCGLETLAGAR